MVRYKMLARDVNSLPIQYRTWVVEDAPDLNAELYSGLKSGDDPLVDVSAYVVFDPFAVVDFNLPNPLDWKTSFKVLPESIYNSHLAVVDGYTYLFGGQLTDKIFRAPLDNPANWEDTEATLPVPLYGSQLAIIDDTIYLFGGNIGNSPTDHIYSAPLSDPLTWTDHGALLPKKLCFSQLGIVDDTIYLFGGKEVTGPSSVILKAPTGTPLVWSNPGNTLPTNLSNSQLAIVDGYMLLCGGVTAANTPTDIVYGAFTSNPLFWFTGGQLPYKMHNSQVAVIADKLYLFGPTASGASTATASNTRILIADRLVPFIFIDSLFKIPGEVSCSQLGIIYDRLFLFGGNGNQIIFANNSFLKYEFGSPVAMTYGEVTRTEVNNAPPTLDLFVILGMPPWKTDYGA